MPRPRWLIQSTGINSHNIEADFETLLKLGYPYSDYGVIPFTSLLTNLENILTDSSEKFVIRGGTKVLTVLTKVNSLREINELLNPQQIRDSVEYLTNLKNGIFYNEQNFDQAHYGQLNLPLLNSGASLYPIRTNLYLSFPTDVFIKPSKDQKSFNAGILDKGRTIHEFVTSQMHHESYIDEMAVIAPCKKILAEYRFFVVEQQVITGSQYRRDNKLQISSTIPRKVWDIAKEFALLYQPHDVFTMDLAETPEGTLIVEYNCWNASGLYATDVTKIFGVIDEYQFG